ncbi:FixH family protein [Thiohalorhabdus methylotrophus]|uniref:FixH family protein n=1 Tax=Thiohalorhabdus methylotrophus TaxID=3242694 RepID=A0ABV4TPU5_9GAMM
MRMEQAAPEHDAEARKTKRTIRLWILAGAVFATTVLGYSATMVYLAQRDYPGSVVNDYFENYKQFNEYADKLENQEELGWRVATSIDSLPMVGNQLDIEVWAEDDQGEPIVDGEVLVHFVRNVNSRGDRKVRLGALGDGRYFGRVTLPKPGNWTILTTIRDDGKAYKARRFLWVEESLE